MVQSFAELQLLKGYLDAQQMHLQHPKIKCNCYNNERSYGNGMLCRGQARLHRRLCRARVRRRRSGPRCLRASPHSNSRSCQCGRGCWRRCALRGARRTQARSEEGTARGMRRRPCLPRTPCGCTSSHSHWRAPGAALSHHACQVNVPSYFPVAQSAQTAQFVACVGALSQVARKTNLSEE